MNEINSFTDDFQIQFQLPAILPGFTRTYWYDFAVPNRDFLGKWYFTLDNPPHLISWE